MRNRILLAVAVITALMFGGFANPAQAKTAVAVHNVGAVAQANAMRACPGPTGNGNIYGYDLNGCLGDSVWMHGDGYPLDTCRNMPAGWGNKINATRGNGENVLHLYTAWNCGGAELIRGASSSSDLPTDWKNTVEAFMVESI